MTQAQRIHAYLKSGRTLTPLQALRRFGCFRLAARINDLRGRGVRIRTELVPAGDTKVARYRLG